MYESGEDYLETILVLYERNGSVRSVDIAKELGFSRPSVSRAMGILQKGGYIVKKENGEIMLTDAGKEKASSVYDRHTHLTDFLVMTAGVSPKTAEKDACRIEHIISPETFIGIKHYLEDHSDDNKDSEKKNESAK